MEKNVKNNSEGVDSGKIANYHGRVPGTDMMSAWKASGDGDDIHPSTRSLGYWFGGAEIGM